MDRKYCYSAGLKPRVSGIVGGWEKRMEEMGLVGGNGRKMGGRGGIEKKANREFSSSYPSHSSLWSAFSLSGFFILLFGPPGGVR